MEALISSLNTRPPHLLQDNSELDTSATNDASLAQWGSSAGFGNLMSNGVVRGMEIPRVPDVSLSLSYRSFRQRPSCRRPPYRSTMANLKLHDCIANRVFVSPHRFNVFQLVGQDQACSRNDDVGIQVPGWNHRQRGFQGKCGELYR
jgi:hypothetical protein